LTGCPVSRFKVHIGRGNEEHLEADIRAAAVLRHLRSPQPTAVPLDIIADHKALIAAIKGADHKATKRRLHRHVESRTQRRRTIARTWPVVSRAL
jgi:DNA-binding FadR family transcriptional regulator